MQQADGSLSLKLDLSRISVLTPEQVSSLATAPLCVLCWSENFSHSNRWLHMHCMYGAWLVQRFSHDEDEE